MKVKANTTELGFYRKSAFTIFEKIKRKTFIKDDEKVPEPDSEFKKRKEEAKVIYEMPLEDYRKLQAGETVEVHDDLLKLYPNIFGRAPKIEKVKNGDK